MKPRNNRVFRNKGCEFCKSSSTPSYKGVDTLAKHITERGKIISRAKIGTCAAHQRKLTVAIKRARILALLPFAPKI